ncbi:MAG: hypothetical protein Q4G23_04495 [Clostridia bacterium]|nr:hypothetical protein [Clostridia bacterium]
MKRKLYVPLMNSAVTEETRETYLEMVKKCGADTVFLCSGDRGNFFKDGDGTKNLESNIKYFEDKGYEVGVWITSLGYGSPIAPKYIPYIKDYTKIKGVETICYGDGFCPEDEAYMEKYLAWVDRIVKNGVKLLMIDDELCLSARPGLGCFCDKHMKLMEDALGESLEGKDLKELFFTGKTNRYRKVWEKTVGDTLRNFAKKVRAKVDETDKNIRVGFCAGYTSWDIEGVDALELTKILAGDNKPFLRFTGAPYWISKWLNKFPGQNLSSVCEMARMQEGWSRGSGVEVFAEADSYPRPRHMIPASYLECFDAAVTASGNMGQLKYMFDYAATPDYETGYMKHHIKNKPLYEFLEKYFTDKAAYGVKVYEKIHKFTDMTLPSRYAGAAKLMKRSLSPAASMLAFLGVPTVYAEESDFAIAFGENVRAIEKMPKKLILDMTGAAILKEMGVDTGFESASPMNVPTFIKAGGIRTSLTNPWAEYYNPVLKEGAEVKCSFEALDVTFPGAYTYKSGDTEFLIFTFDGYIDKYDSGLFTSYIQEKVIKDFLGDSFCYIRKEPAVYQICKKDENETAVFFENLWEDSLFNFEIELDGEYSDMTFFGAEGVLCGRKIKITTEVAPYGMFAVVLK